MTDPSSTTLQSTLPPGFILVEMESVDSVIEEASRRASAGCEEGTLVWAREQTGALTRRGEPWHSPHGNLHCALVLRPDLTLPVALELVYVVSLAIGTCIAKLVQPMTALRYTWPGGLLLNDERVGRIGMACANVADGYADWLVWSVELNIQHCPDDHDVPANSLALEGCEPFAMDQLVADFCRQFLSWADRWSDDGLSPLIKRWQQSLYHLNDAVTVDLPGQRLTGTMSGVDEQGSLMLDCDGSTRKVTLGEYFNQP